MSIAAASAADKDTFRAPAAANLPHRQANGQVTVAADPYSSGEKVKTAFGKLNPYQYDVLPVLVVIQNDSGQTLRVDNLHVEYVGPNGNRAIATPAADVKYLRGPSRPGVIAGPPGIGVKVLPKKNPLDVWEIEGRAFAAKMLPAGQTASGFFYFATGIQRGSTLYLSGIAEAGTGKDLLYFEIQLQ